MTASLQSRPGTFKQKFVFAVMSVVIFAAPLPASAQEAFPTKPVRLVVPYGVGGPTDIAARLLGEGMAQNLGQPVIVENRTGAFGQIAVDAVKLAGADGYTMMYASVPQAVIFPIILEGDPRSTSLKTFRNDFRILGLSNSYDNLLLTSPGSGVKSVKDLIDRIKKKSGPVTYSAYGAGAMPDLALGYLTELAGGAGEPILYKGGAQAQADLMAGRILLAVDSVGTTMGSVKEGRMVALATLGRQRSKLMPDVPTMSEAGLPQMAQIDWRVWNAFFVPAGTAPARIERLNTALRAGAADAKIQNRFSELNLDLLAATSLRDSEAFWSTQHATWQPVIKKMNIKMPE